MKNTNNKLAMTLLGAAVVASLGTGLLGVASAATTVAAGTSTTQQAGGQRGPGQGVAGTVVSVSGNTITLTGKDGKTYTIDAGTAKISKVDTITTANIAAGDTLMVGGTVSGTSVAATNIMDGQMPQGGFGGPRGGGKGPGVMGTVSAISGTTLTVADKNGTSYTVNAAGATVKKGSGTAGTAPATSTLSAVAVGDTVGIRGTVSGTTVTATEIMDGVFPAHQGNRSQPTSTQTSAQ